CERAFFSDAATIVTLTRASVPTVESWARATGSSAPVDVIPTAVDLGRFRPAGGDSRDTGPIIGYVGSVGTWYPLDAILEFCACVKSTLPGARFLFVVNSENGVVARATVRYGLSEDAEITSVPHHEVPDQVG